MENLEKVPDVELWFKFRELNEKGDAQAIPYGNEIQRRYNENPQKYALRSLTPSLKVPVNLYNLLVPEYEKLLAVPEDKEAKSVIKYYKQSAEMEGMTNQQVEETDKKARRDANIH